VDKLQAAYRVAVIIGLALFFLGRNSSNFHLFLHLSLFSFAVLPETPLAHS